MSVHHHHNSALQQNLLSLLNLVEWDSRASRERERAGSLPARPESRASLAQMNSLARQRTHKHNKHQTWTLSKQIKEDAERFWLMAAFWLGNQYVQKVCLKSKQIFCVTNKVHNKTELQSIKNYLCEWNLLPRKILSLSLYIARGNYF